MFSAASLAPPCAGPPRQAIPAAMQAKGFAPDDPASRTVGWVAQWNEMISDPDQKIGRPRQLYTGATQRDYVPVAKR
jgi:citrate synthase